MSYLARTARADLVRLRAVVEETWDELIDQAPSAAGRQGVCDLERRADTFGAFLRRWMTRADHTAVR